MPFLVPGQGFERFSIYKKKKSVSTNGRVHTSKNEYEPNGTFIGGFASLSEKEVDQWKQKGHPISHKIVSLGVASTVVTGNYLVLEKKGVRRYFYVQGAGNPGELNHMARYFCEERKDLSHG